MSDIGEPTAEDMARDLAKDLEFLDDIARDVGIAKAWLDVADGSERARFDPLDEAAEWAVTGGVAAIRRAMAAETEVAELKRMLPDGAGQGEGQAKAWSAVWAALVEAGLLSFFDRLDDGGLQRAVKFVRFLSGQLDEAKAEIAKLHGVIAQHDLCHDQHGQVDAENFARGCAAGQRKLHGVAPDADEAARLRVALAAWLDASRGCGGPACNIGGGLCAGCLIESGKAQQAARKAVGQ